MSPTIAFVTYAGQPELTEGDRLLVEPLARRGFAVAAVPWDGVGVDWGVFRKVVLRSCWDYHRAPGAFQGWVRGLAAQQVALWNPPAVVLWNMDKGYLRALAAAGVPTIPTVWPDRAGVVSLAEVLVREGWAQAVVKPQVGSNADQTWLVAVGEAQACEGRFQGLRASPGVLVQRFMPEIVRGEWSLVFIREQFSHAVLKVPQPGSIFVQGSLGGSWSVQVPAPVVVQQAAQVVQMVRRFVEVDGPLLYARVDGLVVDGVFVVMELELIEPRLFLSAACPDVVERVADAIVVC